MTQTATVERVRGPGLAEISVVRETACSHNCGECAGCGLRPGAIRVTARDPIGVAPGERVLVRSDTGAVLSIAALVYLLPLAALLAGYVLGQAVSAGLAGGAGLAVHALVTVCVTALGAVPAVLAERRNRRDPRIRYEIVRRV